jgi:hypothetical protein
MNFSRHARTLAAGIAVVLSLAVTLVQAQPAAGKITNAKVIEMVKAGLDDDTVVKAIQQGKPEFDTSPDALIELKKQGISKAVLDAMQNASRPGAAAPAPGAVATPHAAMPRQMGVVLVEGDKRTPLQHANADRRASGGLVPFSSVKGRAVFEGAKSPVRIKTAEPVFEVALPASMRAADYVVLMSPEIKDKKSRQIETARANAFAGSSKGKNTTLPVRIEPVPDTSPSAHLTVYRVKPEKPLPAGEYVMSVAHSYYDFGIDAGK